MGEELTFPDQGQCGRCCDKCADCGCFNLCFKRGELPREDYEMEAQQRDVEAQKKLEQQQGDQLPPYPGAAQMQVPKPSGS